MIESVEILKVPTGLVVPQPMRTAQEQLLARFDPDSPPAANNLQSVVNNERSALLFALLEVPDEVDWQALSTEQYIGTLTLVGLETTTRFTGYVEHVVVDERFEGNGIGEMLVREAIAVGESLGTSRLDLTSNSSKEAAQRLYAKTGFHTRSTNNWRYEY